MYKKLSAVLCAVLTMSVMCTTVFASVTSYDKGYGYSAGYSDVAAKNKSTMGDAFNDLVETEIDGSVVGESDYVLLSTVTASELESVKCGNGINNKFIWKAEKDQDGNDVIKKFYGGRGPYVNFKIHALTEDGSHKEDYAMGSSAGGPEVWGYNTTGSWNPKGLWRLKPGKAGDKITFGRYDLDINNGINVFTYKFSYNCAKASNGSWNTPPTIDVYITQGDGAEMFEKAVEDSSFKDEKLLNIDKWGKFYLGDGNNGQVNYNSGYSANAKPNTVKITVDTMAAAPRYQISITTGDGAIVDSKWKTLTDSKFDFTQDMGMKLVITDQYNAGSDVCLADCTFRRPFSISDNKYSADVSVINESESAISGNLIAALYDTEDNSLVSLNIKEVENLAASATGTYSVSLGNMEKLADPTKYNVKFFLWEDLSDTLTPMNFTCVDDALTPTIICN